MSMTLMLNELLEMRIPILPSTIEDPAALDEIKALL